MLEISPTNDFNHFQSRILYLGMYYLIFDQCIKLAMQDVIIYILHIEMARNDEESYRKRE